MLAIALAAALGIVPHSASFRLVEDAHVAEPSPFAQMTRSQLHTEYNRLEDERPGIGLPIVSLAVGAVMLFGSGVTAFFGGLIALGTIKVPSMLFIVAGCVAVAGAALLVVGIVMLVKTLGERRVYNDQLNDIQERLDQMNGVVPDRPDLPAPPPPPPPMPPLVVPPPPSALAPAPLPTLVLASF